MQTDYTSEGVRYKWWLASSEGAGFIVFNDDGLEDSEMIKAMNEIKRERDVVFIRFANKTDHVEDFWERTFTICEKQFKLVWQQMERDDKEIQKWINTGRTPYDYACFKKDTWKKNSKI